MTTVFVVTPEHIFLAIVFMLLVIAAVVHGIGSWMFGVARRLRNTWSKLFRK